MGRKQKFDGWQHDSRKQIEEKSESGRPRLEFHRDFSVNDKVQYDRDGERTRRIGYERILISCILGD